MKNNNVREVDFKEVFKYAEDVEVNGQESSVSGKLDFNQEKGTFTATVKVTTKQVDIMNEGPTLQSLAAASRVLEKAVRKGIELRVYHLEAISEGPDSSQISLLEDSDFINEDNPPRKMKPAKAEVQMKSFQGLGGSAGEKAPIKAKK
jgi:hypothetical protein